MRFWNDKEYKDKRGATITRRTISDTEDVTYSNIQYLGKGMAMIDTPMGEIPVEFEVELNAKTIDEAFEIFEVEMSKKAGAAANDAAKEVMEQVKERMQDKQSSIITPDQIRNASTFNPKLRG